MAPSSGSFTGSFRPRPFVFNKLTASFPKFQFLRLISSLFIRLASFRMRKYSLILRSVSWSIRFSQRISRLRPPPSPAAREASRAARAVGLHGQAQLIFFPHVRELLRPRHLPARCKLCFRVASSSQAHIPSYDGYSLSHNWPRVKRKISGPRRRRRLYGDSNRFTDAAARSLRACQRRA